MILVDTILKKRARENNPILVGIVGAGEMAKGLINQITKHTPGMTVAVTYNRNLDKPIDAYKIAGIKNFKIVESFSDLEKSIKSNISVITQNIDLLLKSKDLDLLVDLTGSIEFSTFLTLEAIKNKINILSFNAELDATIGPIIKYKADQAGVKYSVAEGDQPGVTLNLYRFVQGMGFEPLLCGNIKGMLDHYRDPSTQEKFAKQWGMSPIMATNFADGSKIAFEQACIANATGMKVAKRGMLGYESKEHVDDLTHLYDVDELRKLGGIVDFIVGAKPGPGVFVYATTNDPHKIKYLEYSKLGKGPLYSFYIPYHLLFFEIPISIARMIDLDDTIVAAKGGPVVDVIAVAKVDLHKGDILDEIGGYKTYGLCENYSTSRNENLLPMGLVNGCKVLRNITKDKELTFDDVEIPDQSLIYQIWKEQRELFDV